MADAPDDAHQVSPDAPSTPAKRVCPLTTPDLIELIVEFIAVFNKPAEIHLYTYQRVFQRRIIESLILHDAATITGLFSRQSGKSEALASLAVAACVIIPALAVLYPDDDRLAQYTRGLWVGIFAPKQQQSDIIYGRVRQRADKRSSHEIYADPDINIRLSASRNDRISWSNGSFVVSKTASEQSSVEGDTFDLIFIDEAQLVSEYKVEKEIVPMMAHTMGTMVKIGTANVHKGGFYTSIKYNDDVFNNGGVRNHFQFPYDVVIREKRVAYEETGKKVHLNYENWVTAQLAKLGGNVDNEIFKMNFRLMWQESASGAIDERLFEDAADRTIEVQAQNLYSRQVAGLDLGKVRDPSILTVMEVSDLLVYDKRAIVRPGADLPGFSMKTIIAWYECTGAWEEQLSGFCTFLRNFNIGVLVVDSTGAGDPIAERLQLMLPDIKVVPFKINHVTNDLLYRGYIQEMEAGRIRYAAGTYTQQTKEFQQFDFQHRILEKEYVNQYVKCHAPMGEHDDYCDSAALSNYAATLPGEAVVSSGPNMLYSGDGFVGSGTSRADRYKLSRRH